MQNQHGKPRIRPVKPFISFGYPFDLVRPIDFTASISRIKMFTHRLPHPRSSEFFICCGQRDFKPALCGIFSISNGFFQLIFPK